MEFNGIKHSTNGIDGFERRLSERASAIDELMELVKSIGGELVCEWNESLEWNEFELRVDEINKANQMNANGKDEWNAALNQLINHL